MTSEPIVSVVMPAFNAAEFLDEAVCSILDQTFRDFEFIIVDDGSTDNTASILRKYAKADSRVRVFPQANEGMIPALNRGCRLARGRYIARMDADDISLPHRFEKQVHYLEINSEVGIVGTWITQIERTGSLRGDWHPSALPKVLKWIHFFGGCVCHPAVMMRREVLEAINFYRSDALHAEDIDLWLRASAITEFGNVPEVLFKYRIWDGSTCRRLNQEYRDALFALMGPFIGKFLGFNPSVEALTGLKLKKCDSLQQILLAAALIESLYQTFQEANSLTSEECLAVSSDAAKRMALLSFQALQFKSVKFLSLLMRALRLDYRLLYPSVVMRNLKQDRLLQLLGAR